MKLHPRDLPESIRKHYQVRGATGGKVGLIYKAVKKTHTTIVIWSTDRLKEVWHKTKGRWVKGDKHEDLLPRDK